MKRRKLKDWVIPTLGIFVLVGALFCYQMISKIVSYSNPVTPSMVTDPILDNVVEVNNEITKTIIKPYKTDDIAISKTFYSKEDTEEQQQKSLIKYGNIYMPNTGILYNSDKEFEVVAVLDGKVKNVKQDELLGYIVEVEHENNIVTIYQSLKEVKVKQNDTIKQGDTIALSGSNKLEGEKQHSLHFEVYKDGNLMNPEEFYTMQLD